MINRSSSFSVSDNRLAQLSKAISHPARIAIIRLLREQGTLNNGQIVQELPLAQATVSKHLSDLIRSGLIQTRSEGTRVFYSISPEAVEEYCGLFCKEVHSFVESAGALEV